MAITTQQYASAFCQLVEQQEVDIEKAVKSFLELLKKHNRLADLQKILEEIEKFYKQSQEYSLNLELEYSGQDISQQVKEIFQKKYPDKNIYIQSKENPDLIAGISLKSNNFLIDSSIKKSLNLFSQRTKHSSI
ncbi:MAG: hypothetical protein GF335_03865 [Candidatus Moranbacteria bacterium]|nr:hypothetical protein [Candidatus Moranbacteria bacterium]